MTSLKQRIADDMKSAMKEKAAARVEAVRLVRAAIQRKEIDDQIELDDEGVLAVVQKLVKQSNDSITQFSAGNRPDLVEKETLSLNVFEEYLPEQFSDEEVAALVSEAITSTGAQAPCDMGKVMGWLKSEINGRADMSKLSAMVKAQLNPET